jgi:hypothetical protein
VLVCPADTIDALQDQFQRRETVDQKATKEITSSTGPRTVTPTSYTTSPLSNSFRSNSHTSKASPRIKSPVLKDSPPSKSVATSQQSCTLRLASAKTPTCGQETQGRRCCKGTHTRWCNDVILPIPTIVDGRTHPPLPPFRCDRDTADPVPARRRLQLSPGPTR